ncbi:MAG TPA: hypothetical protein VLW05_05750 [Gaiellaceae bacterium]|nr:hypothetical protein [Gaiellaceae bacterium]
MRIVVNHLDFEQPLSQELLDAAHEGGQRVVDAGGLAFHLVEIDETHAMLVLFFPDLETEERVSREIGGPWMRRHVLPLLAGPTRRASGETVVSRGF